MHRRKNNKFYQSTSGVNSACGDNKPVLVGGIGEINFGKQFRQGNRVYDANAIAMACLAQPVGNAGGFSYLYAIGAAMRGRYNSDGKTEQKIEIRDDELSNAITTVQKDSLVIENFTNPQAGKILPVGKS